jgi:hypothetical protein
MGDEPQNACDAFHLTPNEVDGSDRRGQTTLLPQCMPAASPEQPLLAPFYVNEGFFPPVDGALVLAVVKQAALDDGCGPALLQGVENGSKNGLVEGFSRG